MSLGQSGLRLRRKGGLTVVVDTHSVLLEGIPYRTFDRLRSVHRSEIVENKRLDDMLSIVAEMQAGRDQQRSKSGPRRTGQTNHMFDIPDGSQRNAILAPRWTPT